MKDPLSTLSNICYLILAALVAWFEPANELLIGSLVFLSAASFLHHYGGAEHGTAFHKGDEAGIYAVMGTLIMQVFGIVGLLQIGAFLGVAVLLMRLEQTDLFKWTPALSCVVIAGLFMNYGIEAAWHVAIPASIGAGFRLLTENEDWQHAVWHVLSAASLGLAWWAML